MSRRFRFRGDTLAGSDEPGTSIGNSVGSGLAVRADSGNNRPGDEHRDRDAGDHTTGYSSGSRDSRGDTSRGINAASHHDSSIAVGTRAIVRRS